MTTQTKVKKKKSYKCHKHESGEIRIFVEDVYRIVEGESLLNEQIRLAQKYKNALIANEIDRLTQVQEAMHRLVPEFAQASDAYDDAALAVKTMRDGFKLRSQRARTKYKPTDAEKAELSQLLEQKAEAKGIRDRYRSEAHKGHDEFLVAREAIDAACVVAEKALYATARQQWGLHWGTILVAKRSFDQIRAEARTRYKDPRFRRWFTGKFIRRLAEALNPALPPAVQDKAWSHLIDSVRDADRTPTMEIAVQIQSTNPLSWSQALLCRDTRLHIERQPGSRRVVVWMMVGSLGQRKTVWIKVLCNLHREPPPDTQIKWVRLYRKNAGPDSTWQVHFTLERDQWSREGLATSGCVGIDINWRRFPRGLRVAVAVDQDGRRFDLIIPEYLKPEDSKTGSLIVRDASGPLGPYTECICPAPLITRMEKAQSIRSIRDFQFDGMRSAVTGWLERQESIVPPWLKEMTVNLGRSRSPQRFRLLLWAWGARRFDGDEEIIPLFQHWEERDRHLHRYEWNTRRKALRIRDDAYHKFAWFLARRYAEVRLEDCNWHKLIKIPPPEMEDKTWTRIFAPIAAPGNLVAILAAKFRTAKKVPAEYTTLRCNHCGHVDDFDAGRELIHLCSSCGRKWDIDENGGANIRDAVIVGDPPVEDVP